MRLLIDEPNPLNVLDIREIDFMPDHFGKIKFAVVGFNSWNTVDLCRQWIYNNLSGRFCLIKSLEIVDNKMETVYQIGFEEQSEATMFTLGCPVMMTSGIQLI